MLCRQLASLRRNHAISSAWHGHTSICAWHRAVRMAVHFAPEAWPVFYKRWRIFASQCRMHVTATRAARGAYASVNVRQGELRACVAPVYAIDISNNRNAHFTPLMKPSARCLRNGGAFKLFMPSKAAPDAKMAWRDSSANSARGARQF